MVYGEGISRYEAESIADRAASNAARDVQHDITGERYERERECERLDSRIDDVREENRRLREGIAELWAALNQHEIDFVHETSKAA